MLQADQPVEGDIRPAPKIARLGVRLFVALAATGIVALVGYSFVPSKQAPAPPDEISIAAALQALERGDFALATPALRTWAEAGDAGAQFALARMYANGRGVPETVRPQSFGTVEQAGRVMRVLWLSWAACI